MTLRERIRDWLGIYMLKEDIQLAEFSAERKAESDRLGEEALKRMYAEAKARAPYNE